MPRTVHVCMFFNVGPCLKHSTSYTMIYLTRLALTMDYAWEIVLTHCPQEKWGVQEGSGTHDNPSMQEFQKNMQVLRLFFFCMLTSV